uniref:Ribosomal protein S15 n=1 Tax=Asteropyrum cavaleriei TaxID=93606 RepID=A0A6B7EW49_9MAGN|nr:ribosomal protein S15 [Asteropyrum cavaleriei]
MELHRKNYLSPRGLHKIMGKRQRLLVYLSKKSRVRYRYKELSIGLDASQKLVN